LEGFHLIFKNDFELKSFNDIDFYITIKISPVYLCSIATIDVNRHDSNQRLDDIFQAWHQALEPCNSV
jgi:hypothetical protein